MAVMGGVMDALAGGLGAVGVKFQPTFTRSRVQYLTTHHYYSIEKVRRAVYCVWLVDSRRALIISTDCLSNSNSNSNSNRPSACWATRPRGRSRRRSTSACTA